MIGKITGAISAPRILEESVRRINSFRGLGIAIQQRNPVVEEEGNVSGNGLLKYV